MSDDDHELNEVVARRVFEVWRATEPPEDFVERLLEVADATVPPWPRAAGAGVDCCA